MSALLFSNLSMNHQSQNMISFKTYTLFKSVLYKKCGRAKAIELLTNGWHDHTQYKPNEEVLNHGKFEIRRLNERPTWKTNQDYSSTQRQHEESSSGSIACSERKEPEHEQHQPNICNDAGEKHLLQTVRAGQERGEVTRKRGRPKRVA